MGNVSEKVEAAAPAIAQPAQKTDEPKKLKACCACPETKKARDACIMEHGQENCEDFILAHKECMRKLGFQI